MESRDRAYMFQTQNLRQWFAGDASLWLLQILILLQGFLSTQLAFPQLIAFGLSLFVKSSNTARLNLLSKGLPGLVVMLARLTGTIGHNYKIEQEIKVWEARRKVEQQSSSIPKAPPPP